MDLNEYASPIQINKNENQDTIFMGYFSPHWGHFLIETLSRFQYILTNHTTIKNLNQKIVFNRWFGNNIKNPLYDEKHSPFFSFMTNVFDLDPKNIIIVNQPMHFSNIIIPPHQTLSENFINVSQQSVFDHITQYVQKVPILLKSKPTKLFCLRNDTRISNENEIKCIFNSYGFESIYLTDRTIYDDIQKVSKCDIIAGIEGTSLHNNVFMKPNLNVISINGSNRRTGRNQRELCKVNHTNLHIIEFSGTSNTFNLDYLNQQLSHIFYQIYDEPSLLLSAYYENLDVTLLLNNLISDNILEIPDGKFNKYFGDP